MTIGSAVRLGLLRAGRPYRSALRTHRGSGSRIPLQERPATGAADELSTVDDDLPARNYGVGDARHFAPFVRVVIHLHMQRLRGQHHRLFWIEDDDVGV